MNKSLKIIIQLCLLVVLLLGSLGVVTAQTGTESGSVEVKLEGKDLEDISATPDPEKINDAINERINKQLSQEQEKKLNTMLESINQLRRALFGTIEKVTDDSLTLSTPEGSTMVPIPETVRIIQGSKTIKASDIAVDTWALVVGTTNVTNSTETTLPTLTPQIITIYTSDPRPKPPVVTLGIINSIGSGSLGVTSRFSDLLTSYSLLKTTRFQDVDGSETTRTKFEQDLSILAVGYLDGDTNSATIVKSLAPLESEEDE